MAALVTNKTRADALDANTMTLATVGGADAAMPNGLLSDIVGIDESTASQYLQTDGNSTTANDWLSAHITFAASATYDLSGANQAFAFHIKQNNLQFNTYVNAADSLWAILFSGGGTTNYARWEMNMHDFINGDWHVVSMSGTPDTTGGTFDDTDVTGFGIAVQTDTTGANFGVGFSIDQLVYIDGNVVFEDTGTPATLNWESFRDEVYALSGNSFHSDLNLEAKPAFVFGHGILNETDDFSVSNFTVIFKANDDITGGFQVSTTGFYEFRDVCDSATATHSYTDGFIAYNSGTYDVVIDSSTLTSGTTQFNNITFLNTRNVTIGGNAQATVTASFPNPTGTVDISDVLADLTITGTASAIQWTADLAANSTITTDSDIDITFAGGDYRDVTLNFTAENTLSVDPTGASQNYQLTIVSSNVVRLWNKDTANACTITIPSGISNEKIDLWFNYDTESGGPFVEQELLTFGNGATATLRVLVDNGTTGTMYCTLVSGSAPPDNNSITGGTSSATALVNEASGANNSTLTISQAAQTYTFNSDTASTLIRYFEDDLQTVVDSATGTTLAYEFPDTDPVDVEFLKQGYVPVNRQNVTPSDGGTLDIQMDFDEAYNSAHGLTITSEYDYNRGTKVLTINSDQEALDVRSALADVIRTNSSYYNTKLLMEAIPGLTRVDLIDGATITSMATWKGAGMERFDAADALNPTEKWFAIKSVGNITGASAYYRQTSSGSATSVTLTNNVVNEAFQYWSDPNHDGSTADGYDYSGYMVIKTFLAGAKQGRVDVPANAGLSALKSNLYTVPLSNTSHDYAGTDPGISADITIVAGSTVGGVAFAYEIVDGGTNSGSDIADQLHYNALTTPNGTVPGGTGLTWWELPDMVIYNATSVETERGYREGVSPTRVGFYASRGGNDHPDFTRFQGDNGTYYTPAVTANATGTNLPDDIGGDTRLQIFNLTASTASAHQTSTAYSVGDIVLRTTGIGTENTAGLFFRCISAGTSGGTEPTWVITTPGVFGTAGSQTTDNTVTWECFAVLLYDADPASTGWSDTYIDGEEFADGETARIRFAHLNGGTSFELGQTTAAVTTAGFSFDGSLFVAADSVYAENGVDGSSTAVTNIFTADYANDEIDLDADLNFTSLQFFAYYCYELTSSQGMNQFWGGVTAIDAGNYRINDSVVSLYFDETAGFVRQTDTARIFRADGTRPALDPTTGGAGVEVNWQLPVYVQAVGSALTGPQAAQLSAIETATSGLTYTVANKVDANIHYVNDSEVQGSGTAADPWRPV